MTVAAARSGPLRIAMFVGPFPVLSETFILNQITGLIDRGHDVDIIALRPRKYAQVHSVIDDYGLLDRTYYIRSSKTRWRVLQALEILAKTPAWLSPRGVSLASRLSRTRRLAVRLDWLGRLRVAAREFDGGRYDVIHCQYGNLGAMVAPMIRAGAIHGRFVTSFRGHDVTQGAFDAAYYHQLFELADSVLPVSRSLAERLLQLGCPEEKITVLHSGIDPTRFVHRERRPTPGDRVAIVTVARLVEMKGVEFGIRAVAQLIEAGRPVVYDIVGDGPLRSRLEALIDELGVGGSVRLHGWMAHEQLIGLLDAGQIFLAPSVTATNGETEGIPNSVKEAMALGLPVVATVHSGIPELVEHGVSGYLVPERDVDALAEMLALLCDSGDRWVAMARAGRARIEAEFDARRLNDTLVGLYRGAI